MYYAVNSNSDVCVLCLSLLLQLSVITERLEIYEKAIAEAKIKGESSKVRRYTRALDSIKTMQQKV